MTFIAGIISVLVSLIFIPTASAQGLIERKMEGRCHMGTCSWAIIKSANQIAAHETGILLHLRLVGGESAHRPERRASSPITWDKLPHDVWIFCSRYAPTVMTQTDEGFQVTVLPFDDDGISGAYDDSARMYLIACHQIIWLQDMAQTTKDLGYFVGQYFDDAYAEVEKGVKKPTDILKFASNLAEKNKSRIPDNDNDFVILPHRYSLSGILSPVQALAAAIKILKGDPYGDTRNKVVQNIRSQSFTTRSEDCASYKRPAYRFHVVVSERPDGLDPIDGPLMVDARTGKMACAGLPFLD